MVKLYQMKYEVNITSENKKRIKLKIFQTKILRKFTTFTQQYKKRLISDQRISIYNQEVMTPLLLAIIKNEIKIFNVII